MVIWGEGTQDNNNAEAVARYGVFAQNIAQFSKVKENDDFEGALFLGSDTSDKSTIFKFEAILEQLKKTFSQKGHSHNWNDIGGEGGPKTLYQEAEEFGYTGTEEELDEILYWITQQFATNKRHMIELPAKSGSGETATIWNAGNLRFTVRSASGQAHELVISPSDEAGFVQIFGIHTGSDDSFAANKGYVDAAVQDAKDYTDTAIQEEIQKAITGAIEGAY